MSGLTKYPHHPETGRLMTKFMMFLLEYDIQVIL